MTCNLFHSVQFTTRGGPISFLSINTMINPENNKNIYFHFHIIQCSCIIVFSMKITSLFVCIGWQCFDIVYFHTFLLHYSTYRRAHFLCVIYSHIYILIFTQHRFVLLKILLIMSLLFIIIHTVIFFRFTLIE